MKQVSYSGKYSLSASRAHQSYLQFSFVAGNALVVIQIFKFVSVQYYQLSISIIDIEFPAKITPLSIFFKIRIIFEYPYYWQISV